jgi:hypothetical protein
VILPSNFIISARNMFELFQHPDIFGTMTTNPNWRASEVVWYLLKMSMHGKDPNVVSFTFALARDPQTILNRGEVQRTKLTEFFRMCAVDESAHRFMYQEFPQHYVWRE